MPCAACPASRLACNIRFLRKMPSSVPRSKRNSLATAAATSSAPSAASREDFAKMLEESFTQGSLQEGSVVKGTVVGIEKDLAVIDVGAKTEGRVPLREFANSDASGSPRS